MKKYLVLILFLFFVQYFGYNFYFANLHSHTSYSDGTGVPQEAYAHARNYVDVLGITDHAYYFVEKIEGQDKFSLTKIAAQFATEIGRFVGLWGFEWTGGVGHINVYTTEEWVSRNETDLFGLYKWIVERQALAQFNHPVTTFGTFYDFEYDPLADECINLIEVGNGNWPGRTISDEMLSNFVLALNKGWHVGATANQDNHRPNWGSANDTRTVILAEKLTYESILEALKSRRVYASEDRTAKLIFEANKYPMGTVLSDVWRITLRIFVQDDEEFEKIYLISQTSELMEWKINSKEFEVFYSCDVPDVFEWYYVYAVQKDGDRIVSSPIWVHNSNVCPVNTRVTASGRTVDLHFDLVNYDSEPRTISLLAKVAEQTQVSEMLVNGKEKKTMKLTFVNLPVGTQRIVLTVDGKPAFSQDVEIRSSTVILDESHENFHEGIRSLFAKEIAQFAEVRYNTKYFRRIPPDAKLIVLPLPKIGSFPEAAMLNSFEIDALVGFAKAGGKILLVALENSIFDKSYQQLLNSLGLDITLIQTERDILVESKGLLDDFSTDSLRFVFLRDISRLAEIVKEMVEK